MRILIGYASANGSTKEVAQFIGRILSTYKTDVTVAHVSDIQSVEGYDVYVLGSAIHTGLWLQEMCEFVERFQNCLVDKTMYFWVSCIRAVETDGREHALKYYFHYQALKSFDLRDTAVFTGKLDTRAITRQELWLLVANYDGKMTTANIHHDYRNWQAIAAWTNKMATELKLVPAFNAEGMPVT